MSYYVRLLTAAEKTVPFNEIEKQGNSLKLVSGSDALWEKIEIYEPADNLISVVERLPLSSGDTGQTTLAQLKSAVDNSYPLNAREWLKEYLSAVKTIYSFQLIGENITKEGWPVMGRVQNLLKDTLTGIVQADNEGFYNEEGDYILWQMYAGAAGTIPAATLDEKGQWISAQLRLDDDRAIEQFKQGLPPPKGFLNRFLGR
jgi:hypothetical protein